MVDLCITHHHPTCLFSVLSNFPGWNSQAWRFPFKRVTQSLADELPLWIYNKILWEIDWPSSHCPLIFWAHLFQNPWVRTWQNESHTRIWRSVTWAINLTTIPLNLNREKEHNFWWTKDKLTRVGNIVLPT